MDDKVTFFALSGNETNGRSLYCVDINGDIYVFSCGCGYPDRFTPGVDLVIPNFSYLVEKKEHIKGIFISHAHDDEYGALPYLYKQLQAPIYCTAFTALSLNILTSERKLDAKYNIIEIDASCEKIINNRKFTFYRTVHSAPDSYGLCIETSQGNIVFSGDYVIEYTANPHFKFDFAQLNKVCEKPTLMLMMDSVNAEKKGYCSPNHHIRDLIYKGISDTEGAVFIACYSQHVYNYVEIINVCLENGKNICFYDQESETVFRSLIVGNIINVPFNRIVKPEKLDNFPRNKVAIIISGNGELLYRKVSLLALKENENNNFFIAENDTFILACPPAPNFEVLAVDCLDELYRTNCSIIDVSRKNLYKMHPCKDDISLLISLIRPKYFIPIKGEYKDLIACAKVAKSMDMNYDDSNVFVLDNGDMMHFEKNTKPYLSCVPIEQLGGIMVDGSGVGDVANEIIIERNKLSTDGVIVMSCLFSKTLKKVIGGPDIQMRGYLYVKDSETILKGVTALFLDIINKFAEKPGKFDLEKCTNQIKDECGRYTKRTTLRTPVIEPSIIIVD